MGGLLGDVFFHTLPHLKGDHDHGHTHIENPEEHENSKANESHDHGHHHHSEQDMQTNLVIIAGIFSFFLIEKVSHIYLGNDHGHSHGNKVSPEEQVAEKEKKYKSFAIVSMVGDFIHNFTDGLSIGVSYVADYKMGLITTVAMFFHEIPHEVGDFAILF